MISTTANINIGAPLHSLKHIEMLKCSLVSDLMVEDAVRSFVAFSTITASRFDKATQRHVNPTASIAKMSQF
jgi:hypothetical protein